MGADMFIELVIIDDDKPLDKLEEELFERIADLDENDGEIILEILDELNLEAVDFLISDEIDELNLDSIKQHFNYIIKQTHEILRNGRRDVTDFSYKGSTFYVTGGMSHGDSPTDSCDRFIEYNTLIRDLPRSKTVAKW